VVGAISVSRIASERDEANHQRELAERRYADSLEGLGRQALLVHTPERALPMIATAATVRGEITPTLGVLGAQTRAAYAGLVGVARGLEPADTSGDLASDGVRAVTATNAGAIHVWDFATGRELWSDSHSRLASFAGDVVIADGHGAVVTRAVATGKQMARWPIAPDQNIDAVRAAPDGIHFAVHTEAHVFVGRGVDVLAQQSRRRTRRARGRVRGRRGYRRADRTSPWRCSGDRGHVGR